MQRFRVNTRSAIANTSEKAGAIRPFLFGQAVPTSAPGVQGREGRNRWQLLPLLVLLIGFAVSLFLFSALRDAVEDVARLRFERHASDGKAAVESRINAYADVLYGLRGLFASHPEVNRLHFHRFVRSLDLKNRYPGFDVVNFAAYVRADQVERFVETVRRDTSLELAGYPDFEIKPPGQRAEYFVVAYLEPMAGYEFAFGRDLGANPQVAEPEALMNALHSARDSGKLTASGVPIRINAGKEYVGLALRLPVYRLGMPLGTAEERRAAYLGSVGAGFNIEALMQGVLSTDALQTLHFALYDVGSAVDRGAAATRRLLFQSSQLGSSAGEPHQNGEIFKRALPMEVGGRVWQVEFQAAKRLALDRVDRLVPWFVLLVGVLSSVLLSGVLFSLSSSTRRAVEMANDMTKHLRTSEASLAEAQRMARLGSWALDPASRAMRLSDETYRLLALEPRGADPLHFSDFVSRAHPEDRNLVEQALMAAIDGREQRELEYRICLPDGGVRWVHAMVQGDAHAPVPGTIMDITERKRAEQELLESRALLSDAQKLAQIGCCQYSPHDGRIIWSDELYRIHGVDRQTFSLTFPSATKLVHPMDRATWIDTVDRALRDHCRFSAEFRIILPSGEVRHVRSLGEVIKDATNRPLRMLWSVIDITDQKQTEEALRASAEQLKAVSRRLVAVQESERRQLSRELHDRVGQNLTALSINLGMLRTSLTGAEYAEHRARLEDCAALLESTVDSIENVTAELRPPMLDDYGLLPALQWYAAEFTRRTGIEVVVSGDEGAERLDPELEITLFRIAQEALTNVAKHAAARRAEIALDASSGGCVMKIIDDGIGIEAAPPRERGRRGGLGMVTMRERSQAVGGRFLVRSLATGGTEITITVP